MRDLTVEIEAAIGYRGPDLATVELALDRLARDVPVAAMGHERITVKFRPSFDGTDPNLAREARRAERMFRWAVPAAGEIVRISLQRFDEAIRGAEHAACCPRLPLVRYEEGGRHGAESPQAKLISRETRLPYGSAGSLKLGPVGVDYADATRSCALDHGRCYNLADDSERPDGKQPLEVTTRLPSRRPHNLPFTMIDLFAGAGGLSLGLRAAGFESILAVESSTMAAQTYFRNFIEPTEDAWLEHASLPVAEQVRRGLAVATTKLVLENVNSVRDVLHGRELDLLAGGPPCQGFSMAGLRNPEDVRNRLPFEFLEFVRELSPRLVLIENVAGIGMSFLKKPGQAPLEQLREALTITGRIGYVAQILELNARDFGIPQNRPRVMIVGLRRDLAASLLQSSTEEGWREVATERWSSSSKGGRRPRLAPELDDMWKAPISVRQAIGDLGEDGYLLASSADYGEELDFARRMRFSSDYRSPAAKIRPESPLNHVKRRHKPLIEQRFRMYIALRPYQIRPNIFGLTAARSSSGGPPGLDEIAELLRQHKVPEPLFGPNGEPVVDEAGTEVGVNHLTLARAINELRTRKHSQRALDPNLPSPTILSLPDDFVHYVQPRTLTVREMARIQSFPDSFVFYSKETTGSHRRRFEVPQYTQVGNAVPPMLAKRVGLHLSNILRDIPAEQVQVRDVAGAYETGGRVGGDQLKLPVVLAGART